MDFAKYRHLKKLVQSGTSLQEFFNEIGKWPRRYGVPSWSKANYQWFFDKIKGGHNYESLFKSAV